MNDNAKLKEARSEVNEQVETLAAKDRMFKETTERLLEESPLERTRKLDEQNHLIERSKMVLDKVQTTYQTQGTYYEAQTDVGATLIKKLKREKEAMEEKVSMDIKRIRIIVRGWREPLHQRLEENVVAVWEVGTMVEATGRTPTIPRRCRKPKEVLEAEAISVKVLTTIFS